MFIVPIYTHSIMDNEFANIEKYTRGCASRGESGFMFLIASHTVGFMLVDAGTHIMKINFRKRRKRLVLLRHNIKSVPLIVNSPAVQYQNALTAYLKSKQLLHFDLIQQSNEKLFILHDKGDGYMVFAFHERGSRFVLLQSKRIPCPSSIIVCAKT